MLKEIYQKMREYADNRDYDLSDEEILIIIEEAEEDGDSVLDCADGALRELVEDWVADHQE
jgi:Ca2+-binding EF-hand superfamily protein